MNDSELTPDCRLHPTWPSCGKIQEAFYSQSDTVDPPKTKLVQVAKVVSDLNIEQVNAYFAGLLAGAPTQGRTDPFLNQYEWFLSKRFDRREKPGKVLLVIGTGRNGSTSMAWALRGIPHSLVTHERPPLLHWNNPGPRLEFHAEFFRISRKYFAIVGDVSHWWLPHANILREMLGPIHFVYLHRDLSETVASFERIKLRYNPPLNHWLPHQGEEWRQDSWDACYPNVLDIPLALECQDDEYKKFVCRRCISQYVKQYQLDARQLIEYHDGIELQLESLFTPTSARVLSNYLGCDIPWRPAHLNEVSTDDSTAMRIFHDFPVPTVP